MTDYDFSALNDKEFENISIDLVSIDKQKRFERFKSGRDGGIDGRFYRSDGKEEIIQCKHYLKTGFSGLISSLKKKSDKGINEIDKVHNLNPSKYIFTTSLDLSADNKKTIKDLFEPYIKSDNDIYGQEDLNSILSDNSKIEEKYYKLWISSTTVLKRLFSNAINGRSEALIEDIRDNTKFYVITDNHNEVLDRINETNIVIIAGEPGIGKTTLAEHIALHYIEKNFEFYDIENSINEAESIFDRGKKQIFYFDDFLGSNYLEAIESKKDSHIMKFIERVKKDKNKRFILTSRTNIFNQSISRSDIFASKNIEQNEFIIQINSLKDIDKAHILYNHIWHSDLEEEYKYELYKNKRYKDIIKHRNFNPRIISFMTDIIRIKKEKIKSDEYWDYINSKLNNPKDIWKNTFDTESDEFIRSLIVLVVLNGNRIEEQNLKNAYIKYCNLVDLQSLSYLSREFDNIVEEVVKYFLNRTKVYKNKVEYSLFNPSITDFILDRYSMDIERLFKSYYSLNSLESLRELYSLYISKRIQEDVFSGVIFSLLSMHNEYSADYSVRLYNICKKSKIAFEDYRSEILNLIQKIIDKKESTYLISEFSELVLSFKLEDFKLKNFEFLSNIVFLANRDIDDINSVINLYDFFDVSDSEVNDEINSLIYEYFEEELLDRVNSISEFDIEFETVYLEEEDGTYESYKVEEGQVESVIDDIIDDIESNIEYFEALSIDRFGLKNSIEIEDIEINLADSYTPYNSYEDDDIRFSSAYSTDDIDDLFEQ